MFDKVIKFFRDHVHVHSKKCLFKTLKTRNVKMAAIAKFVVFNSVLPLFDMGTDIRSFVFYLSTVAYHPNWAALTLMWILVPFVLHLLKFLYHLLAKTGEADWKDLLLHIPFVLPLRNLSGWLTGSTS